MGFTPRIAPRWGRGPSRLRIFALAVLSAGCQRAPARPRLTIAAAVSLAEPLRIVATAYGRAHPGVEVALDLAASGELARQVEAGAPVDVFVSADEPTMDRLVGRGLVAAGAARVAARNQLALITHAESLAHLRLDELVDGDRVPRIAIGAPASVPAGAYARRLLEARGLYARVAPRLVYAGNVRQVLDLVSRGEVDAGLVYRTDVRAADGVHLAEIEIDGAPEIRACVAPISTSNRGDLAAAFVELVTGPVGRDAFAASGFDLP
jgi:molybdate transport system substrate-binding protein